MHTDWKIDVAMVDSMGDPLHNVMHSMGTDSVMGWNTGCYTGTRERKVIKGREFWSIKGFSIKMFLYCVLFLLKEMFICLAKSG